MDASYVPHLRRSDFILQPTDTSGFLPQTRKSDAFWGPFATRKHLAISHLAISLVFQPEK
jgi:hypothetical protein